MVAEVTETMVARTREVLSNLSSSDANARLKALRSIKNQIIGNKSKKLVFIDAGAVPRIVELLSNENEPDAEVLVQCAVAVGSFAYGMPAGLQQVLASQGGLQPLLRTLANSNLRVVEAGVRALKLIFQSPELPRGSLLGSSALAALVRLLSGKSVQLAEAAAIVLSRCCQDAEQAQRLAEAGAAQGLLDLLTLGHPSSQAVALEALAPLLMHDAGAFQPMVCLAAAPHKGDGGSTALAALMVLLKDAEPRTRFTAACCLTYLTSAPQRGAASAPAAIAAGAGTAAPMAQSSQVHQVRRAALTVLLRLLAAGGDLSGRVPPVLARLIENSDELQRAAADADAIRLLAGFVAGWPGTSNDRGSAPDGAGSSHATHTTALSVARLSGGVGAGGGGTASSSGGSTGRGGGDSHLLGGGGDTGRVREGTLRALGSMCMNRDASRKQLIEAKVLTHIVRALEDTTDGMRAAAAMCVMALTRSVKNLRSNLLTTDVATLLCKLLGDPSVDVQVNAAAAICNLVLEFSAVKLVVLQAGGLKRLAQLSASSLSTLRLHSTWALRNLVYKSDLVARTALIQELPWPSMLRLLSDPESAVQEQAICILRNMCMDGTDCISAGLAWPGGRGLVTLLEEKLDPTGSTSPAVKVHALFLVVNVLTGNEEHKAAIMNSKLPVLLAHYLAAAPMPASVNSIADTTTDKDAAGVAIGSGSRLAVEMAVRTPATIDLRLPAVWCIINLTWPSVGSVTGLSARLSTLRELGIPGALRALACNEAGGLDLQERARTALQQLG